MPHHNPCLPTGTSEHPQEVHTWHLQGKRMHLDGQIDTSQQSKAKYCCEIQGWRFSISLGATTRAVRCLLHKPGLNRCFQTCLEILLALPVMFNSTVLENKTIYSTVKAVSERCSATGFEIAATCTLSLGR